MHAEQAVFPPPGDAADANFLAFLISSLAGFSAWIKKLVGRRRSLLTHTQTRFDCFEVAA